MWIGRTDGECIEEPGLGCGKFCTASAKDEVLTVLPTEIRRHSPRTFVGRTYSVLGRANGTEELHRHETECFYEDETQIIRAI
jgi:hypothetical protein